MVAKDFRKIGWASCKTNWGLAIGSFLLFGLIVGALSATGIGAIIITGPMTLGYSILMMKLVRRQNPGINDLFGGFQNFGEALLLGFLNMLFVSLWSLLLFVPGIIKYYSYSMSFFILNDNPGISQSEARKRSMEMMKGNKGRLFCLHLSFIGWILLSSLTFGILSLWVAPAIQASTIAFYEEISGKNVQTETGEAAA